MILSILTGIVIPSDHRSTLSFGIVGIHYVTQLNNQNFRSHFLLAWIKLVVHHYRINDKTTLYPTEAILQRNEACCIVVITV